MDIPEDVFEYNRLIRTVEKIDSEAAKYLREDAQLLPSFEFSLCLLKAFRWYQSPQGHHYWSSISKILGEGNYSAF